MNKNLKLFASDMDGTFLRSDLSFDRSRLDFILKQFKEKNLLFAAASGRSLNSLQTVFSDVQEEMAFVADNGAVVAVGNEIIFTEQFIRDQVAEIAESLHEVPHGPKNNFLISGIKGSYALESIEQDYFDFARIYYPNLTKVAGLDDIDDSFIKLSTGFPPEHVRSSEQWLNDRLPYVHATTSGFTAVDIIPNGINKAVGLNHLLQHLGWKNDNLVVFGDQMNDFEMLKFSGTSYAVQNAVDEVKQIADEVIGTNNEDSVLEKIEELVD